MFMNRLLLGFAAGLLLVGCAHYRDDTGGTGTPNEVYQGTGHSPDYQANDLDDLGYSHRYDNQKPNGQPRVPGHSVDINNSVP